MSGSQIRTILRDWQGVIALALSPVVLGIAMAMARPVVQPIAAGVVSDSLAPVRREQRLDRAHLEYITCDRQAERRLSGKTPDQCFDEFRRALRGGP
jgi:hypothetical protein